MEKNILRNRITLLALLFAGLFLLLPVNVRAEEEDENASERTYILYDRNSGLPTSEANAIVQTGDGFIWIGSYSGLIRYDGNEFIRYNPEVGIASVMSLCVDSRDRLWVGTNDSGAALYENGEFRFYRKEEGLASLSVRAIAEDGDGNILLATTKGLAYVDADGELHSLSDGRLDGEYIRDIISDEYGNVYGVTSDSALFMVEGLKVRYFMNTKDYGTEISCIYPVPGSRGKVYLGTWGAEVITQDIAGWMEEYDAWSVAPLSNINRIFSDDGEIWVCADNGVGYFKEDGTYYPMDNLPLNNSVDGMMKDYEGNFWFVSSRQGIMEITPSPFRDVNKQVGLDSMVVNSTCIYKERLYIGTDRGLVILDKKNKKVDNKLTKFLDGIRIRCIKADSQDRLWLCCYNDKGLVSYNGKKYTTYNTENGLVSNWVRATTELEDGRIAVACSGGLSIIEDGEVVRSYAQADGIENTEILAVCDGGGGKILLGSDGDGIYIVDGDNISHMGMEEGLQSEIILRIKKDPMMDLYWIVTSNSISYLQNGQIGTVTNFPYSNNFDIYFSADGEMWILSSNGIYVVESGKLLTGEKLEYDFYDFRCGLPYVPTANSRSQLTEDGTLYISGTAGVCSINIENRGEAEGDIRLCVPFIGIDDEIVTVQEGKKIVVPSSCKRLTIYGYALTYKLQNPHLSYRLRGFDKNATLTTVNDMEPVSYTNLDGGDYTFILTVVDSRTGEAKNTVTVKIRKKKALYEYALFWVVIAAVVIAAVAVFTLHYIRKKTASLLKKQEENKIYIHQLTSALAKSIDLKDKYTNGHSFRVARYSKMLAERLGYSEEEVDRIYHIALLHDIGKITIPDEILCKPGKLTNEEYEIIKKHAANGYDILKEIEIMPDLALGAGFHHERIDGKGYPSGKAGDEIPKVAQIIAVADTFDAMNSTRPYRKKMMIADIEAELQRVSGTQLNADIVKELLAQIAEGLEQFDTEGVSTQQMVETAGKADAGDVSADAEGEVTSADEAGGGKNEE